MIKTKYVDYCIGECVENELRIHKDLINYPKLFEWTLEHEFKHFENKGKFWADLWVDFVDGFKWEAFAMWLFFFKYPKALLYTLIPIKKNKETNNIEVNVNLIITYVLVGIFLVGICMFWLIFVA